MQYMVDKGEYILWIISAKMLEFIILQETLTIKLQRIAIECDEHNQNEVERQKAIEKELNCKFLRFNPDDSDFELANLQSDILGLLLESTKM